MPENTENAETTEDVEEIEVTEDNVIESEAVIEDVEVSDDVETPVVGESEVVETEDAEEDAEAEETAIPESPSLEADTIGSIQDDSSELIDIEIDEILKEFNERWFHGWQATPEDQKTKLVSIVKAIKDNEQYREFVVGNPDPQTSSDKMNEILDSVVRQKRKSDASLYKSYLQNEAFKADFRNLIIRMLDNLDYLQ